MCFVLRLGPETTLDSEIDIVYNVLYLYSISKLEHLEDNYTYFMHIRGRDLCFLWKKILFFFFLIRNESTVTVPFFLFGNSKVQFCKL